MLLELIVAAATTAATPALPPLAPVTAADAARARRLLPQPPPIPPRGALPNGGRACLVLDVCDPRPCVRLAPARARRGGPPHPTLRCGSDKPPRPPRLVPATSR